MPKYGERHIDLVIAQMMRSQSLFSLASAKLEGSFLRRENIGGSVFQALLFDVVKATGQAGECLPDKGSVVAEFDRMIQTYVSNPTRRQEFQVRLSEFFVFAAMVEENSERIARKVIEFVFNECVVTPEAFKLLDDARASKSFDGVGEKLVELVQQSRSMSGGMSVSNIVDIDLSDIGERQQTYIPWLDAHFGGGRGPVLGSYICIIAPQGAGKTTLGIQLVSSQSSNGRHGLLVLAEEGLSQSVRNKIVGSSFGFDYELLETMSLDEVVAHVRMDRELAAKRAENLAKYFHVLDLVNNPSDNPLAAIEAEIEHLSSIGQCPTYVYVDWAGIIADATSRASGGRRTKEQELQALSFGLSTIAPRNNCNIVCSQQMAATAVAKGPGAENDHYCAADCRLFTAPAKYVFTVNKPCPKTGCSLLHIPKARDDRCRGQKLVLKLSGNIPMFEDIGHQFELKNTTFVRKNRTDKSKEIPK